MLFIFFSGPLDIRLDTRLDIWPDTVPVYSTVYSIVYCTVYCTIINLPCQKNDFTMDHVLVMKHHFSYQKIKEFVQNIIMPKTLDVDDQNMVSILIMISSRNYILLNDIIHKLEQKDQQTENS